LNKEEIISSGLLEAYITGDVSDAERQEIENWLREDEDVRKEYEQIQNALEMFAFAHGVQPPGNTRKKIMDRIGAQSKSGSRKRINTWRYFAAASIIVALTTSIAAYFYWRSWKNTESELLSLLERNEQLAQQYHRTDQQLTDIKKDLDKIVSPEFDRIVLSGTENAPYASAVLYWNAAERQVLLNAASLSELSHDQQYQLWALVDGQPVDAGVFDAKEGTFQNMKQIDQADAFAITIEPRGGSKAPTLSTMQVFGKAS